MSFRCWKLVVLGVLGIVTAACATTPRADPRTEEEAIRELDRRWVREIAARNVSAVVDFYADDGMVMAPNAPAAKGKAGLHAVYTDLMKEANNLSLTFEPTQITVAAAGDVAHDIGTYRLAMDTPGGRINDSGKYITLWKKVDGQWKVAADMFNSDLAPPAIPRTP